MRENTEEMKKKMTRIGLMFIMEAYGLQILEPGCGDSVQMNAIFYDNTFAPLICRSFTVAGSYIHKSKA